MATPKELMQKLKYGTAEHRKLLDAVRSRLRMSERKMRDRYTQMARNEDRFQAYIPESDLDALRKNRRNQSGIPAYRTIEIPYSYAVLMTAHTYYSSVFLSRSPVMQVMGRNGEAEMNTQAVEAVLEYQRMIGEMMVPLFIWLLDPGKYGFGVVWHYWDEQYINVRQEVEEPVMFMGMPLIGVPPRKVERVMELPKYRGNKIFNVRPQDFFPDPRVPMRYFQRGEFVGRYVEHSWFDVVEGERQGRYFNVGKLRAMRADRTSQISGELISRETGGRTSDLPDDSTQDYNERIPAGFIKSFELYLKVHPKEWGFGSEDKCEIWVVTISTNGIIYGCEPHGEYHGEFPCDVIEHEPEGYSMFSRSMLEICEPLTDVITWLVNTHFYNVRQTLNNQFVVDPSMVVMKDVQNPDPGKVIRLKEMAYGKDVRTAITQLQTQDVTRGHLSDMSMMGDFIQRVTGVVDPIMGMTSQKSHTTATAVRTASTMGINRMKTNCEYYSAMGWSPFIQKLIQRTQQYMTWEDTYRVAGELSQFGKPFVQVNPQMISGFYDFVPVDGTLPVDRFAQANLWQQLFGQITKFPQIAQSYDIAKIFAWVAQLAGIKNMQQFRLVPDEMMQRRVDSGNVIPLGNAMREVPPSQANGMGPMQ